MICKLDTCESITVQAVRKNGKADSSFNAQSFFHRIRDKLIRVELLRAGGKSNEGNQAKSDSRNHPAAEHQHAGGACGEALKRRNFNVTQATVSRDIKELRLLKTLSSEGVYRYTMVENVEHTLDERFRRIFSESVLSVSVRV